MSSPTFKLKNEIVRAGAGAGKTTRLTLRVIEVAQRIHEETGEWPRLVITTFTRKATQELRERLIVEACRDGNPDLIDFVSSKSKLFISTIHGVLGRFLKSYGYLAEVDPNYTIMSPQEARLAGRKIFRDILFSKKYPRADILLSKYSFDQLFDMATLFYESYLERPELVPIEKNDLFSIYSESLNKMAVVLFDYIENILSSIPADQPWFEFLDRLKSIVGRWSDLPKEGTPSGRELLEEIGALPRIAGKAIVDVKDELKEFREFYKKSVEARLQLSSYQPECWSEYIEVANIFSDMGRDYSDKFLNYKIFSGKFEMVDLELVALNCLRKDPGIAKAFSADWDYWLIDEFQDTSPIQVELLQSLVGERPSFVVGDPQQSIYLFRGARSEVFTQKEEQMRSVQGELSSLQKNWRSQPELLIFFNNFFEKIGTQFISMEPRRDEFNPEKVVATYAIAEPSKVDGEVKEHNENLAMASYVLELVRAGARLDSICILGRTNKVLSDISTMLDGYGIPTHVHAASGFYSRREVIDALAVLKFLINPHDNINLILLFRSPWLHISDECLVQWCEGIDEGVSHWSHILCKYEDNEVIQYLKGALGRVRQAGFSETLKSILIELGFVDVCLRFDPTGRRESNIWKLLYLLRTEEELPGFNCLNFIDRSFRVLSTEGGDEESDAVAALEPNRVNLMTVHSSKGLQFDHVIVPRMERGRSGGGVSPLFMMDEETYRWSLSVNQEDVMRPSLHGRICMDKLAVRELEEVERLLYVALTRAKESVFLSWCGKPRPGSWASLFPLEAGEGIYKTDHYSFKVDYGPWEVTERLESKGAEKPIRSKLNPDIFIEDMKSRRISVSSVLSDQKANYLVTDSNNLSGAARPDESPSGIPARLAKAANGTKFHRALEILKYNNKFDFSPFFKNWMGEKYLASMEAMEFVRSISEIPFFEILNAGKVEWGFQLECKLGLLEGQIDLWGKTGQGESETVWLVDYKSGSTKYKKKGFEQLGVYAHALREFGEKAPIKLVLIYPFSKSVEVEVFDSEERVCHQYGL